MAEEGETHVRVAARVRPLLPREKAANCCSCVTVQQGANQIVVGTRRAFSFDVVFDTDAGQREVYDGCVAPLLVGCMQGYNATVMAYGQTGSGKTFTLGLHGASPGEQRSDAAGCKNHGPEDGITHQVIRACYEQIDQLGDEVEFKVSCCYMELYNEDIRDLLCPGTPRHMIAIRETTTGHIQVAGIHAEACSSADDMMRCLVDGSVQRTTGATLMNEQSSRSHSIFTIILEQRRQCRPRSGVSRASGGTVADDDATPIQSYRTAKFHLVDLAGSERLKRTGAVGSRFRESVAINAGLLALGNVISALGDPAKRGSHVPYRDSKLTRLLQDSLGGNSSTWMIACASCADADFEETLNTLKYANRARNIKNKPVVNHDPKAAQLAAMQDEIEALRSELRRASEGVATRGAARLAGTSTGGLGRAAQEEGEASAALDELSAKLEDAEQQNLELRERLVSVESECEMARRALAELCATVNRELPAIWQAPGGATQPPGEAAGGGGGDAPSSRTARQALTAVCEALQAARPLLGDTPTGGVGDAQLAGPFAPPGRSDESVAGVAGVAKPSAGEDDDAAHAEAGEAENGEAAGKLSSFAEARRDSSALIRKYLEEMRRLETELALYRRRERQLQAELQQAREDLQQDEDIFEEKMQEMKSVAEENEALRAKLCELRESGASNRHTPRAAATLTGCAPAVGSRPPSGRSCSSSSRAQRLEQQIDEHLRRQEARQCIEEDRRKQEKLLQKRDQYTSYREKIAAKDAAEQQEARGRLRELEGLLDAAERGLLDEEAAGLSEAGARRARRDELLDEHTELQRSVQKKHSEARIIIQNIDERLESLQDEIDFREARIAKASQSGQAETPSTLEDELAGVPGDDARELLLRFCEKIIRLRQREKDHVTRLSVVEAQLKDKGCQASELQRGQVARDESSARTLEKLRQEFEAKVSSLEQELEAARAGPPGAGGGAATGGAPPTGARLSPDEAAELEQLRRDSEYYKGINRELKRRLRAHLDQRDSSGGGSV